MYRNCQSVYVLSIRLKGKIINSTASRQKHKAHTVKVLDLLDAFRIAVSDGLHRQACRSSDLKTKTKSPRDMQVTMMRWIKGWQFCTMKISSHWNSKNQKLRILPSQAASRCHRTRSYNQNARVTTTSSAKASRSAKLFSTNWMKNIKTVFPHTWIHRSQSAPRWLLLSQAPTRMPKSSISQWMQRIHVLSCNGICFSNQNKSKV